eukprot:6211928-Pleurochrysis_carterae.AAC.2
MKSSIIYHRERKNVLARAEPSGKVGRSSGEEELRSQRGQKNLAEVCRGGDRQERGWEGENGGARRRRRRVREKSFGDGVSASGWQTPETSASRKENATPN